MGQYWGIFLVRFLAGTSRCVASRGLVLLFLIWLWHPLAFPASFWADGVCATYPGRVVDEMALHQQFVRQRLRQGFLPMASSATAPAASTKS